jgi:hypothetical protein
VRQPENAQTPAAQVSPAAHSESLVQPVAMVDVPLLLELLLPTVQSWQVPYPMPLGRHACTPWAAPPQAHAF